jgi:quinol monooxygenase YgiN
MAERPGLGQARWCAAAAPLERGATIGKVSVIATLTCKDGKADAFPAAFDEFFRHVESEDGTESYVLHRSTTNPNVFFMTELYTDQGAFDAHAGSDAFAKLGRDAPRLHRRV